MQRLHILIGMGFLFLLTEPLLIAVDNIRERRSETLFQGAQRCFRAGQWATAADWFLEFGENNPDSPRRNKAILLRAQSLFRLKEYRKCFNELKNAEDSSGRLAAEYKFWMAECRYREAENASKSEGNYRVAAQLYAEVPKSGRLVAANVSEAMVYARLEDWSMVVELLQPTTSPFKKFALSSPETSLTSQGHLILAEALLRQELYSDATGILSQLSTLNLPDQDSWRHQMLFSRALVAQNMNTEALNVLKELLRTSENRMPRLRAAQAAELKLLVHIELGEITEALKICRNLRQEEMPRPIRRRALLLALNLAARHRAPLNIPEFRQLAEELLKDNDLAVAQVTMGEMYLRTYQQNPISESSLTKDQQLAKAREQFRSAIGSDFSGHARIGLAWNAWQEQQYGESQTNFIQAANKLINPKDRSWAQFKAIESAFLYGDMLDTLNIGYDFLKNSTPSILRDSARFLMARAAIRNASTESGSIGEARQFVAALTRVPNFGHKEEAILLLARAESRNDNPTKARELLRQITANIAIKSIVELEIARTFIREKKWPNAISHYETWLEKHGDSSEEQRAKVTFDLGWLHNLNNDSTTAVKIFSDIAIQFPNTIQAAQAQMWVADHLFNLSVDGGFAKAEEAYQKVRDIKKCSRQFRFRASLMAGRSALARRNFSNARDYLSRIISDAECPKEIHIEAVFALGDAAVLDPAKGGSRFEDAISILETNLKPNVKSSPQIALQAHGRIGDCHLQMAAEEPDRYHKALESYKRVIELSNQIDGDPPVRFRAMLGMAQSLKNMPEEEMTKRKSNLIRAVGWAKKVFEGATATEKMLNPFWIRQSGLMSAELQILVGNPLEAVITYEILGKHFKKMKLPLDARINRIRQQLRESNPDYSGEK